MRDKTQADRIRDLKRFDPLDFAEKITGKDSHSDDNTVWLGMGLMQENKAALNKELLATGDTVFSMAGEDYLNAAESFGFGAGWSAEFGEGEKECILYRIDGLLLYADSYQGGRNSAKVWYNWKPSNMDFPRYITSSGGMRNGVWCGDHDAREGLNHAMLDLAEYGEFLNPWKECPFLWLLNHEDSKVEGYSHKDITKSKVDQLPAEVIKMISC